jgi:uncharacterized membrane protein YjjP (DUF1212 family)
MHWIDMSIAMVAGVLALMLGAYASRATANLQLIVALEVVIVGLIAIIRAWDKRRWHQIDWLVYRPPQRA